MDQVFRLDIEENPDHDETEGIILHGDGDEELIQGEGGGSGEAGTSTGPVVIVIDEQIVAESEKEIRESVRKEIDEALNAQVEDMNVTDLDI